MVVEVSGGVLVLYSDDDSEEDEDSSEVDVGEGREVAHGMYTVLYDVPAQSLVHISVQLYAV